MTTRWVDQEFEGHDFTDEDLSRLWTERVVFTECDFGGSNLAESAHHGLRLDGERRSLSG